MTVNLLYCFIKLEEEKKHFCDDMILSSCSVSYQVTQQLTLL